MATIRLVYEWWPQAVGVRGGWKLAPAEPGLGLRELVQGYVPALKRLALEASRRRWRGWTDAQRRHAEGYAERGDCREDVGCAMAALSQGLAMERCYVDLREERQRAVLQALRVWEALSGAERSVMCRELEPAKPEKAEVV